MTRHLCDEEITSAIAEMPLETEAREHLASCLSCRKEVQAMQALFEERRTQLIDEAPDWDRQQQQILDRLPAQPIRIRRRRWLQPVMALAASVVVAVGISVIRVNTHTPQPVTTAEVQLEDILAETESLLADDSIPGLWVADPVSDVDDIETLFGNGAS